MKIAFLIIIILVFIFVFLSGAVWGQKRYIKRLAKFFDGLMDEFEMEKK